MNPDHDYYVCFDQLDLGFTVDDPRYGQRLIGLILAASAISKAARNQGKRLSVTVFLRDDIYELLHFEDKNKITEDELTRVEWDRSGSPYTLKSLMERRFGELADLRRTSTGIRSSTRPGRCPADRPSTRTFATAPFFVLGT